MRFAQPACMQTSDKRNGETGLAGASRLYRKCFTLLRLITLADALKRLVLIQAIREYFRLGRY